jgi:hypothetical protein
MTATLPARRIRPCGDIFNEEEDQTPPLIKKRRKSEPKIWVTRYIVIYGLFCVTKKIAKTAGKLPAPAMSDIAGSWHVAPQTEQIFSTFEQALEFAEKAYIALFSAEEVQELSPNWKTHLKTDKEIRHKSTGEGRYYHRYLKIVDVRCG